MADEGSVFDKIGGFGDSLNDVGVGNLGSLTPLLDKMWVWAQIFFWVVVVIAAVMVFWKFYIQFNKRIRIVKKSGGKIVDIIHDKAKVVVDAQGKRKLVLWKTREGKEQKTLPIPLLEYKYKCGKNDYYDLWMDDNGNLHPMEIGDIEKEDLIFVKPKPQERKAWDRYEDKIIEEKYRKKDWIDKYGTLATTTVLGTVVILTMFFMFQMLGKGLNNLAGSIVQVSTACGLG